MFSYSDQLYMRDNCSKLSDLRIAKRLNKPVSSVVNFRVLHMKLIKGRSLKSNGRAISQVAAMKELIALQAFDYKGVMLDSVNYRISVLQSILNNGNK